jgi:hypothetical protein
VRAAVEILGPSGAWRTYCTGPVNLCLACFQAVPLNPDNLVVRVVMGSERVASKEVRSNMAALLGERWTLVFEEGRAFYRREEAA